MTINQYGFEIASGAPSGIKQVSNVSCTVNNLPARSLGRLESLMAWRIIGSSGFKAYAEEARGAVHRFHERIRESYGVSFDKLSPANAKPADIARLAAELAELEFDASVGRRAEALYAADAPMPRKVLYVVGDLAMEFAAFVNRRKGEFVEVQDVDPGKRASVETIHAELLAAEEKKRGTQLCLPPIDIGNSRIDGLLNNLAATPHVAIQERLTPERAPRELPPMMTLSILWPQAGKLHAVSPGNQMYIEQPDALGIVVGLFRDQIAAKLRDELERKYEAAKQAGTPILSDKERSLALKEIGGEIEQLQRQEAFLFWKYVEAHKGAAPAWTHSDMNIPALLGIK